MSRAEFEVAYDGTALRDHTMDVEHLAPALLGIGDLCREANRVLNGERAGVAIRVRADFEHKCFDIHFELVQSVYSQIKDLVSDDHVATAKTVLEWLGLLGIPTGLGLLGFRKIQKGRKVEDITEITTSDGAVSYNIRFEGDSNVINIAAPVYNLAQDHKVSKAEKAIVRPLLASGFDRFEVREKGKPIQTIEKHEVGWFGEAELTSEFPQPEPATLRTILELRAPVFVEGEKWLFHFGEDKISAEISDRIFLNRVFVYGERFGAGDKLQVDLMISQYQTSTGKIKNAYEISKVYNVWAAQDQPALPLDDRP